MDKTTSRNMMYEMEKKFVKGAELAKKIIPKGVTYPYATQEDIKKKKAKAYIRNEQLRQKMLKYGGGGGDWSNYPNKWQDQDV